MEDSNVKYQIFSSSRNGISLDNIFRLPVLMNLRIQRFIPWFKLRGCLKKRWAMAFAPSPTNSNFSFIDSISEITTIDMSDENNNNNQPAPNEEDFPSRPGSVLEKEGSLNSSMITIIVSPAKLLYTFFLHAFFSTGQRHPISTRFSLPRKGIGDIKGYYYLVRVRLNPFEWR